MNKTKYVMINGELYHADDALCHYGVKGMRWGVRRAVKQLHESNQSGRKGDHNYAVSKLSTHRDKINKKLTNLDKQAVTLEAKRYKQATNTETKIAKLERKSAKALRRSYKTRSVKKANKYKQRSASLDYKASRLKEKTAKLKSKIEKNERLKEIYKKGLNEINNELVVKGQNFLYMKPNGMPYTKRDIED